MYYILSIFLKEQFIYSYQTNCAETLTKYLTSNYSSHHLRTRIVDYVVCIPSFYRSALGVLFHASDP